MWCGWETALGVAARVQHLVDHHHRPTSVRTVGELVQAWICAQVRRSDLSERTLATYRACTRHLAQLGDLTLDEVKLASLERYRDARIRGGAASRTVALELAVFRRAWSWYRDSGAPLPAHLPRPRLRIRSSRRHYTPTVEELARVQRKLEGWPRLAVELLVATGARIGEIADLRARDVSVLRGEVLLCGKTGPRSVPLPPELAVRAGAGDPERRVLGVGAVTVRTALRRHIAAACEAAGVHVFTPHDLRRLAVDRLYSAGVDVGTVAALLGQSPQVALRHYRQPTREEQRGAMTRAGLISTPQ